MIYDYRCLSDGCRREFQLDLPISTPIARGKHSKARCPHCRSKKVKKILHRVNVVFKGSGFYSTDK